MWESTTDDEAPVANFTPDLDIKWPEPDPVSPIMTRDHSASRKSSCWSSPPNIFVDEGSIPSSPVGQAECWSAPECLNDDDDSEEEEMGGEQRRMQRACSCCEIDVGRHDSTAFSGSYPVIDTAHQGMKLRAFSSVPPCHHPSQVR
ncbi:unnamed protein product [Strongylus vulgaris]|uniref:Uncharacterized protein n=1 Tax=Strongylus vulgaris TaxID=40348 RepID=A0A3P7J6K8_STRVU|nr:unnamed protein product [Strongylus vulgaris]